MKPVSLNFFGDRMTVLMPIMMQEMWAYERGFFTRSDITLSQLWALTYLYGRGSSTMREMSRAMHSGESTTSGLVDRMTRTGLLKRQRDKTDRRVVRVHLTARGRAAIRELQKQRRRAFIGIFSRLSSADRSRWLEIVEKLIKLMSPDKAKDST